MLKEIRIHGRGGQGSVVLAQFFAIAALEDGKQGQAFPFLGGGGERRGAPIQAFARISDQPIRLRSRIQTPDYVIVQDATILAEVNVFAGVKPDSLILINSEKPAEEQLLNSINRPSAANLVIRTLPATGIAMEIVGKPIPNAALAGAFSAISGELSLEAVLNAIEQKLEGDIAEKNIQAARKGYLMMSPDS